MSARVWTCDRCGERDHWGPGWEWYGGIESTPDFVVCSPECKAAALADPECESLALARMQALNYGRRAR